MPQSPCDAVAGKKIKVGGQAIIEGVMMRSPGSLAMAVRRPDGKIVVREQQWIGISHKYKFLRWPFLRGTVVLIESMTNGVSALTFSANQAAIAEAEAEAQRKGDAADLGEKQPDGALSTLALIGTVAFSLGLAILLFMVLPHVITALLGRLGGGAFDVDSGWFHLVDGLIKFVFFLAYVWGISFLKDIRRVFEYHGAEHKSIFTYEAGRPLTPHSAHDYGTLHPRCGTSFLMLVLSVSIILFSASFVLLPKLPEMHQVLRHLIYILIKLPLLIPIAGIAYEVTQLAGKHEDNRLLRLLVLPGIWFQHLTTREPTDDQVEIALIALRKVLWREQVGESGGEKSEQTFDDYQQALSGVAGEPAGG
ncbi:MAG: DUF1385 domain-containing protein [Candidatus Alcyoniella australis]|nr:DUF1385 domain-containing protein [Candidatus Alcyoniella australis]